MKTKLCYPLTLPMVNPDLKKRWAYRNKMIKGTETTTEVAAHVPADKDERPRRIDDDQSNQSVEQAKFVQNDVVGGECQQSRECLDSQQHVQSDITPCDTETRQGVSAAH